MNNPTNTRHSVDSKLRDSLMWLVAIALTAAGVVGNIYYQDESFLIRALVLVAVAGVVLGAWLQTTMGQRFRVLYRGARIELRKVVWPSRQETLQSSLVVLVVVALISLVLWLFDNIFSWLISLLVGV